MGENLLAKVMKNFSASLGDFGQKSFARLKICLFLRLCPGVGQKYVCRGAKVAKFYFYHSKLRKQLFLQNILWEMSNLKILGVLSLPSDDHSPKTFYNKKPEENNKTKFTDKHMMNFENNSQ